MKHKSIMQEDIHSCYLCGMNENLEKLDLHHVFNSSNKKKSEQYGLIVWLHHRECHIFGKDAVHQSAEVNKKLKAEAQKKSMEYYGWSVEKFIKIFGKNYI